MVTPLAVAVAADEITTVVALVTLAMVAPPGIPAPVMKLPTSALVNAAVADVTVRPERLWSPPGARPPRPIDAARVSIRATPSRSRGSQLHQDI